MMTLLFLMGWGRFLDIIFLYQVSSRAKRRTSAASNQNEGHVILAGAREFKNKWTEENPIMQAKQLNNKK